MERRLAVGGGKGGKKGKWNNNNKNGRKGKGKGDGDGKGGKGGFPSKCLQDQCYGSSSPDGKGGTTVEVQDVDRQLEKLREVYDLLLRVRDSADAKRLTDVLSSSGADCLPNDLQSAMKTFRDKLEDLDRTLIPAVNNRARYLLAVRDQRAADQHQFTDDKQHALQPDKPGDADRMRTLMTQRRLMFKGFSFVRTMQSVGVQLVRFLRGANPGCNPSESFRDLLYDWRDRLFYAAYGCNDSAEQLVVRFGINGANGVENPLVVDLPDGGNKVVLYSDGSVAAAALMAKATRDVTRHSVSHTGAAHGGGCGCGRRRVTGRRPAA